MHGGGGTHSKLTLVLLARVHTLNDFLFELAVRPPQPNRFPPLPLLLPPPTLLLLLLHPLQPRPQFNLDKFQLEFG